MAKGVELIGGPMGGQWVDIDDDKTDYKITSPDIDRIHKEFMTAKEDDAVPVKHGTYRNRYSGSRVFDWQGWD